jgi:hypothetical protein
MTQKKNTPKSKKQVKRGMNRGQKIMAVIGVLIIISMVLPYLLR